MVSTGYKAEDIFEIDEVTNLNYAALENAKIKKKVFEVLNELEKALKITGDIKPEESLFVTTKQVALAEHAVSRVISTCENAKKIEAVFEELQQPIVPLIKTCVKTS